MVGAVVSHYRILERIGSGGMGVVYKAEDLNLRRLVALKFLPVETATDPPAVERFRREARAASALNHPNICTIHDFGEHEGQQYIVMELLEGRSLQSALAEGPLPLDESLPIAVQIAEALDAAHARGTVHRDIKPGNIFIASHGHAKVLDFGLAKIVPQPGASGVETVSGIADVTRSGMTLGTLPYMSPEQARGQQVDGRSDLFSFGAVLYEMVTGIQAFQGRTPAAIFESVLSGTPAAPVRLNPKVPSELERIIAKALEKDAALRYQSAAEMRADLRRLQRDASGSGQAHQSAAVAARPPRPRLPRRIGGGIALLALCAVALFLYSRGTARPLSEKDTVLIADFENITGEPVFDGTLKQALAIHLEQSPYFNVFPEQQVRDTLRLMNRPPDEGVTREIARQICEREGITAMLVGSIAPLGSSYVVTLEGVHAVSGNTLAREQTQAGTREDVLNALGAAASKLRGKLGESVASIEKFDRRLDKATTSSLEALRLYTQGRRLSAAGRFADAIPFFTKAAEVDPEFAMAHGALVAAYSNSPGNHGDLAERAANRAFELRDRVTERERYQLVHYYLLRVEGDVLKARENLELAVKAYPRHYSFHNTLSYMYRLEGKYEQAVAHASEGLRLADGPVAVLYANHGVALRALGRYDQAKQSFAEAQAKNVDTPGVHMNLLLIAFAEGDRATIERELTWAKATPSEARFAVLTVLMELFHGRRPPDAAATLPDDVRGEVASYYAALGDCAGARGILSKVPSERPKWERPMTLALCDDPDGANRALGELAAVTRGPYASERQLFVPLGEALVEHARGNFAGARQKLQPALRYQMGQLDRFWTTYVTALAYLGEQRATEAAAEFEKILSHRSVDPASPLYPLAHLGLARAARIAGDRTRSRKAFDSLFPLWHRADADLPAFVLARAEAEGRIP